MAADVSDLVIISDHGFCGIGEPRAAAYLSQRNPIRWLDPIGSARDAIAIQVIRVGKRENGLLWNRLDQPNAENGRGETRRGVCTKGQDLG